MDESKEPIPPKVQKNILADSTPPSKPQPLIITEESCPRNTLNRIEDPQLSTLFDETKRSIQEEFGKSVEEIYRNGTHEERRKLNQKLFTIAERIENPDLRIKMHRLHFRLAIQHMGQPVMINLLNNPTHSVIYDFLPNNFELSKGLIRGKERRIVIDFEKFEELFLQFCDEYRNYRKNPGKPLIENVNIPP